MSLKDISSIQVWLPSSSAEWNHLGNFERGHYDVYFCEITLNLHQWLKSKYHINIFSYLELWWLSCSTLRNR